MGASHTLPSFALHTGPTQSFQSAAEKACNIHVELLSLRPHCPLTKATATAIDCDKSACRLFNEHNMWLLLLPSNSQAAALATTTLSSTTRHCNNNCGGAHVKGMSRPSCAMSAAMWRCESSRPDSAKGLPTSLKPSCSRKFTMVPRGAPAHAQQH